MYIYMPAKLGFILAEKTLRTIIIQTASALTTCSFPLNSLKCIASKLKSVHVPLLLVCIASIEKVL